MIDIRAGKESYERPEFEHFDWIEWKYNLPDPSTNLGVSDYLNVL